MSSLLGYCIAATQRILKIRPTQIQQIQFIPTGSTLECTLAPLVTTESVGLRKGLHRIPLRTHLLTFPFFSSKFLSRRRMLPASWEGKVSTRADTPNQWESPLTGSNFALQSPSLDGPRVYSDFRGASRRSVSFHSKSEECEEWNYSPGNTIKNQA